jgi:hypothetical protein
MYLKKLVSIKTLACEILVSNGRTWTLRPVTAISLQEKTGLHVPGLRKRQELPLMSFVNKVSKTRPGLHYHTHMRANSQNSQEHQN